MPPSKEEMIKFSEHIESVVGQTEYTYLEAIVDYCKVSGLEVEVAATLIHPALKAKIETQVADLNMLKEKPNRLPI